MYEKTWGGKGTKKKEGCRQRRKQEGENQNGQGQRGTKIKGTTMQLGSARATGTKLEERRGIYTSAGAIRSNVYSIERF